MRKAVAAWKLSFTETSLYIVARGCRIFTWNSLLTPVRVPYLRRHSLNRFFSRVTCIEKKGDSHINTLRSQNSLFWFQRSNHHSAIQRCFTMKYFILDTNRKHHKTITAIENCCARANTICVSWTNAHCRVEGGDACWWYSLSDAGGGGACFNLDPELATKAIFRIRSGPLLHKESGFYLLIKWSTGYHCSKPGANASTEGESAAPAKRQVSCPSL